MGRFVDWVAINAEGTSGGILILWDSRVLQLVEVKESHYSLSCEFRNTEEISMLFASLLRGIEGKISSSMRRFSQIIDELKLKDLPFQGGPFTWRGGLNNQRMAKLDRFLVTDEWDAHFGGVVWISMPRPTLDHFPILLEGWGLAERGPLPFRFENMWLKVDEFKNLINEWWQSIEVRRFGSYVLTEKLKALKAKLRLWNREVFRRVDVRKKDVLKKVAYWDFNKAQRPLSLNE